MTAPHPVLASGDVVVVAMSGDFGKPRPALVVQSSLFDQHPTFVILPITSMLLDAPLFRISVAPTASNGLRKPSQVMVDKPMTVRRERMGKHIGRIEPELLSDIRVALVMFLGLTED